MIIQELLQVTKVHRKKSKIPIHRSTKIPKRYERNTITTDLHRAENITSNMKGNTNHSQNVC